jgi:hypothetical protein
LADVALRVIGYVDEQSSNSSGQLFSSYRSRSFEIRCRQRSYPSRAVGERRTQFCK